MLAPAQLLPPPLPPAARSWRRGGPGAWRQGAGHNSHSGGWAAQSRPECCLWDVCHLSPVRQKAELALPLLVASLCHYRAIPASTVQGRHALVLSAEHHRSQSK